MFQIDNSTAVAAIPAPTPAGQAGYFTDGNPATGVSATILPAEFMNMLMMENMNVLSAAGITPAKGQYNQLALAIAKIVQGGAAGQASETTAGILKLSTNPQALAGTDDSTAITPLKLAQKLANFLGQATEAAFGWLKIATQALVNAGADDATAVTPKKLAITAQSQVFTAFTAGGTAPAFTLTPTPAIGAYALNQRFQVSFSAAGGATPTLNISGQGAKNLKQYNSSGAKVAAIIAAGQTSDVFYDGTDFVVLDPLPANALVAGSGGWLGTAPLITGTVSTLPTSQLVSTVAGTTTDYPSSSSNNVGLHAVFTNTSFSADLLVAINSIGGQLMFRGNGPTAGLGVWRNTWHDGNFDPTSKITGNTCTAAGFASGDKAAPFMAHTDGTIVSLATTAASFGIGQTYQNLTASRALNTLYTNATGKMITVLFTGTTPSAGQIINAIVDGNTVLSPSITAATSNGCVSFPVPAGSNYRVTQTAGTMVSWWEVR